MPAETEKHHVMIEKMKSALNRHDLDAFVDCFDAGYQSEQPVHPARRFAGKEQVRKNWSGILGGIPDFHAEVLRSAGAGDTLWAEWDWQGTRPDGTRFHNRGVTIMGLRDERITWGRLYIEPVEAAGAGIDASVKSMTQGQQPAAR